MRLNVYIDGLNLYYGAVKGTKHKWLDIERLFTVLRPHDEIRTIYYFTALISGSGAQRQLTYLRALESSARVQVVLGKFKLKTVKCGVSSCQFSGDRRFQMPEEKRTDVHIALAMLSDAWEGDCDGLVLVSGDSDLVPAIGMMKQRPNPKKVIVYIPARHPQRGAAIELRAAADKHKVLPNHLVKLCQFPDKIPDGSGSVIQKPPDW